MKGDLEIGDWVSGFDGWGQLLFIRELYVEPFVQLSSLEHFSKDEVFRTLYGIKVLCDDDGKIKKRHSLKFSPTIRKLNKKELQKIKKIQDLKKDEYHKYKVYSEKDFSEYALELEYLVEKNNNFDFLNLVINLNHELSPCFTFKEFARAFRKNCSEFNLNDYAKIGEPTKVDGKKLISFVFYSRFDNIHQKQRLFTGVRLMIDKKFIY